MNIFGQATGPAGSPLTRELREGGEQRTFRPAEQLVPPSPQQELVQPSSMVYYTPEEARNRFAEHLPIEASPNDSILPSDDPRVYTYRMQNGNTYMLPAYQEQLAEPRTTGDVISRLIDRIPSRTQVEDALLSTPRAIYDSIDRQVSGEGTYSDVLNTASGLIGANTVPRSRFTEELLNDNPPEGPNDYWEGVDEDFTPAEGVDLEFENFDDWEPEPEPQRPLGADPFEQVPFQGPAPINIDQALADVGINPADFFGAVRNQRPTTAPDSNFWVPQPVPLREGNKPNSGISPVYPPRDYVSDYAPDGTIVFRSPVVDVVAGMQVPSQGIKGSQFIKMLQDNPSVRNSEVSYLNLGISPEARYSREELQQLVDNRVPQVEAYVNNESPDFPSFQRQKVTDDEVDYAEIVITATPQNSDMSFRANSQHFDDNALAHARASIRLGDNDPYLLVEEMQSDLIQKGWAEPEEIKSFTQFGLDPDRLSNSIFVQETDLGEGFPTVRSVLSNIYRGYGDELEELSLQRRDNGVSREGAMQSLSSIISTSYPNLPEDSVGNLARYIRNTLEDYNSSASNPDFTVTNPPIRNTQESTRLLVESLISYADRNGVDEIVFPPFERILAADRFRPGSKEYEKAITPGSGFHQTYVTSLKKVLQELQREFGQDNLPISRRELSYPETSGNNIDLETVRNDWNDLRFNIYQIHQGLRNRNPDVTTEELGAAVEDYLNNTATWMEDGPEEMVTTYDYYRDRYGSDFLSAGTLEDWQTKVNSQQALPSDGISINIGALRDQYNLQYPRFAEGGLVTQTKQAFGGMI